MGQVAMKLVFRMAGVGFSLPVASLVEIREGIEGGAPGHPAAAEFLELRGEMIPLRDLRSRLALPDVPGDKGKLRALVLVGTDGPWGVLVDRVEGIFPEADFRPLGLPLVFSCSDSRPYERLDLWRGEPLVVCDVARLETGWGDDD